MNKFYFYCFLLFITSGCKKDVDLPPADEQFVKNITVKGAKEVKVDYETGIIQIVLPEGYTDDLVKLNLGLYTGASLVINPGDNLFSPKQAQFYFKASYPGYFVIQRDDTGFTRSYKVYVEHQGGINAEITSDLLVNSLTGDTSSIITNVKINSGVGTIPDSPESPKSLISTLTDQDKGVRIDGNYDIFYSLIYMESAHDILNSKNLSLSLSYGEKSFKFPAPIKVSRAPATAYVSTQFVSGPLMKSRLLTINGGSFLENEIYRVKISNDSQVSSFWIDATYINRSSLTFTIPSQLKEGNYLISYYEGGNLISSQNATISDNSAVKTIGLIWTQKSQCPSVNILYKVPQRVKVQAGLDVYAIQSPFISQSQHTPFNPNKDLPDLELKNADHSYLIKAKVNADACYGDGTIFVYYGAYTIPANTIGGKYEARFIYADKQQSLTYWNFIEVN